MRIAVIGSNSFSGSHFVSLALAKGFDVLGISRSSEVTHTYRAYSWGALDITRFKFVQADINRDIDYLVKSLKDFRPNLVINFAAQSMVGESWLYPSHWYQTNVVALSSLVEQLQNLPTLEKYVHVTTPEVYGSTNGWVSESENFAPSTPYAISRAAGDWHLTALHKTTGFPVVFTRAANVYGPGQRLYRIIPRATYSAANEIRVPLHGGGTSTRCFIHVADVAEATWLVAMSGQVGQTYHISTDQEISIRSLVDKIFALQGKQSSQFLELTADRVGKDSTYLLDSSRIRGELGWEPQVSLDQGIEQVQEWVLRNLPHITKSDLNYEHKA